MLSVLLDTARRCYQWLFCNDGWMCVLGGGVLFRDHWGPCTVQSAEFLRLSPKQLHPLLTTRHLWMRVRDWGGLPEDTPLPRSSRENGRGREELGSEKYLGP